MVQEFARSKAPALACVPRRPGLVRGSGVVKGLESRLQAGKTARRRDPTPSSGSCQTTILRWTSRPFTRTLFLDKIPKLPVPPPALEPVEPGELQLHRLAPPGRHPSGDLAAGALVRRHQPQQQPAARPLLELEL